MPDNRDDHLPDSQWDATVFFAMDLTVITSPLTNRTVVINDPRKYNAKLDILSIMISFSITTLVCSVVVTMGTIFLVKSRELLGAMTGKKSEKMSEKDAALVGSVTAICIIYIICTLSNFLCMSRQ